MPRTEWGVALIRDEYDKLHRGPMTQEEAELWVTEWEADGGRPGTFVVVSRKVGPWLPPKLSTDQ